MEFVGHAR